VFCWLYAPDAEMPAGGRARLEKEEFAVADEA
jgi:hypothetical protein